MKRFLTSLFIIVPVLLSAQQTYRNPVLHLDYSDPDVCRVGNDYYMTASSFNCFPGLPVLHSKDLVNWELIGSALLDYPGKDWGDEDLSFKDGVSHGNGVWAPAIRYHEGWFYIYVGDPDRGVFMVKTKDPWGSWEEPVWVVRQKGFIDPCPLWDEDGKAYLSHGEAGSRAGLKSVLFVAPMSADGTRLIGPSRIVYDGHLTQPTIEGTKFYKRDGKYYIFSPAGGVATGWQTVLRSDSPFGPFEERIVLAYAPGTINGPHQGAWVTSPEGEDWFVHFQDKGAYGRIVHLQPMVWKDDGWPLIGEDPDGDGVGQPVKEWSLPGGEAVKGTSLKGPYGISLDWQYPSIPSPYWHMSLPEDGVRLYSVQQPDESESLWDCRNLLLQKFPSEKFTLTAKLSFRPNPGLKERGENGGLIVMGNDYAGIRITDTENGALLQYVECKGASKGETEKTADLKVLPYSSIPQPHPYESLNVPRVNYPDIQEAVLWVRVEVSPDEVKGNVPDAVCRFFWSTDGKKFTRVEGSFKAQPELWIGAKVGFYCNRTAPKNDSGCLDVTDITILK